MNEQTNQLTNKRREGKTSERSRKKETLNGKLNQLNVMV